MIHELYFKVKSLIIKIIEDNIFEGIDISVLYLIVIRLSKKKEKM